MGLDVGYFPKQRGRQAQSLNLGFIETLSLELSYTRETGVGGGRGGRGLQPGLSPVGVMGSTKLNTPLCLQGVACVDVYFKKKFSDCR